MSTLTPSNTVPQPIELVFKEADGVSIAMDVYIPERATKESPVPVLLWWHGGGLIKGTRKVVTPHMRNAPAKHNLCIVSVDYRLAPQTRIPAIISDSKSALDFIRSTEFANATGHRVDGSRIVVSGSSAGGWLALLAGTGIGYEASGVEPPKGIKGVVALYPITDLLDPFWTTKQRPTAYMDRIIEDDEMIECVDPNSRKRSWSIDAEPRGLFYTYMVQEGILQSLLLDGTGIDPVTYSVAQNVRTGRFPIPPTYIITGNRDTKVPHRQSLDVVEAYKIVGANVEYHEIEGLDHRFDEEEKYDMATLYEFVKKTI